MYNIINVHVYASKYVCNYVWMYLCQSVSLYMYVF